VVFLFSGVFGAMSRKRNLNKNKSSARQVIGNPETEYAFIRLASVLVDIVRSEKGGGIAKEDISGLKPSAQKVFRKI